MCLYSLLHPYNLNLSTVKQMEMTSDQSRIIVPHFENSNEIGRVRQIGTDHTFVPSCG